MTFTFSCSTNRKFQHSQGRRFWTGYKPSKALNFYKTKQNCSRSSSSLGGCSWFHKCMLVTNLFERKVLESSISILSPQCPIGDRQQSPKMLLLCSLART